jgi:multidrug efflux system outer membrane protein
VGSPIYYGGRLYKTVKQSDIAIALSGDQLDLTERGLFLQVIMAYATCVKAQRQVEITKESLDLARRQLRQVQAMFEAGETVRLSVLRAEAQVAAAEGTVIATENALGKAKRDLAVITGLEGGFQLKPVKRPELPSDDLETLVRMGLRNRVEFRAMDKQLDINKLEIEKAFGEKLPAVNWAYTFTKQRAGFPTASFWALALNVTVPVYDSGISSIRQAQQKSARRKLELQRQLLAKQVRADIEKAYLDYKSVVQGKRAAERMVKAARLAYNDIERFYKVGETTDLEVQDMRRQLTDAEIINSNLETDEAMALYLLRHFLGLPTIELTKGIGNEVED